MDIKKVLPGKPYPHGAEFDGKGINFSLFSQNAHGVDLCLFDNDGNETSRVKVVERTHNNWHIYIPGLKPGQLYGYRVHGPYEPVAGARFNPNKLLIDPYARALQGTGKWSNALFGYEVGHKNKDLSFSAMDSAPFVPKSVVVDNAFHWDGDSFPKIPLTKTIIYELHVKGFTRLHPLIPNELRGTFAGLAHPESIKYLRSLGVNAVELMPVHQFVNSRHLVEHGLTNYWGYNSINYFSPHAAYASSGGGGQDQVNEFKSMVKALHKEGIEVILDVVYNHSGEGDQLGPTLSFRGIDNASYYRLKGLNKREYLDFTGTGNTLNIVHPAVLRLVMDSLRYWVTEMHVDGFRFDLASTLARESDQVDKYGSFLDAMHQDPVLSQVKLIAEPWDLGENGYQAGNFPAGWLEWNGRYRDSIRQFWRGDYGMLPEFAHRITGSSDMFFNDWRRPVAGINFITAHDGFTLRDLVSYNTKHNAANKEGSRDGENHNHSMNFGVEGDTNDKEILKSRNKQKKNLLTTLFLSQGVPMLAAGDELGHTQKGNNNAYCHDNELSWIDWNNKDENLIKFTSLLIHLRVNHPVFRRENWFRYETMDGRGIKDIEWFTPEGNIMMPEHWDNKSARSIGIFLHGEAIHRRDENGIEITDNSFYLIFNSHQGSLTFKIPGPDYGKRWLKIVDTHEDFINLEEGMEFQSGRDIQVEGRTVVVLRNKR